MCRIQKVIKVEVLASLKHVLVCAASVLNASPLQWKMSAAADQAEGNNHGRSSGDMPGDLVHPICGSCVSLEFQERFGIDKRLVDVGNFLRDQEDSPHLSYAKICKNLKLDAQYVHENSQ